MPKGKKSCPSCSVTVGARTTMCECGFLFGGAHKKSKSAKKLGRKKVAKVKATSVATITIPPNQPAVPVEDVVDKVVKKRVRKFRGLKGRHKLMDIDWRELQKGDYIKSLQGYGPVWPKINPLNGIDESYGIGNYGYYKVLFVRDDGIGCLCTTKGAERGFCFLYMGPDKRGLSGSLMRAHKVKRFIPGKRD